jgi:hypothetical protein
MDTLKNELITVQLEVLVPDVTNYDYIVTYIPGARQREWNQYAQPLQGNGLANKHVYMATRR